MAQRSDKCSPRHTRHLDFIAQFDTFIQYKPGEENIVADALSRVESISIRVALDSARISAEQARDDQLPHLLKSPRYSLHRLEIGGKSLIYTESNGNMKPYFSLTLRRKAFDTVHRLSQPSGRATAKRVASKYSWPSLRKDVLLWAK